MGFSVVARVTDGTWTACAVQDQIHFGLLPGEQLDLHSTLCKESREALAPVVIDHASTDPKYREHHTPKLYKIESYISVPIVMRDGSYFGNLCASDPRPAKVSDPRVVTMFSLFAELITMQLENQRRLGLAHAVYLDERATGELREQFVAILGHDLRSPLAAISASAEIVLRHSGDPAKVLGVGQRIANSARRMGGLINDVLDFARGRLGGGFGVHLSEIADFEQAMRDIVTEVQLSYPDRSIRVDADVAGIVRCDRGRVQQLVSNLLENALTYGAPDRPVRFSAAAYDNSVVLTVRNEGEPIPQESIEQVFAPFWRRTTTGSRQGLGLGLFICSEIAKAHGGTLEVISSDHDGTTFAARLPYAGVRSP
jgi:signal transduction histidine kinase